jgi:hypothetical protein
LGRCSPISGATACLPWSAHFLVSHVAFGSPPPALVQIPYLFPMDTLSLPGPLRGTESPFEGRVPEYTEDVPPVDDLPRLRVVATARSRHIY